MLKTVEKLVNSSKSKQVGNHFVVVHREGDRAIIYDDTHKVEADVYCTREFWYHSTIICAVNDKDRGFYLSHGKGKWWTQSTNRALNDYREYFTSLGYRNVWKPPIYKSECR